MKYSPLIAKHIHDVYFGGNWTCVNVKDTLADVTLKEALTGIHGLNTIATLSFHIHYYTMAIAQVLEGLPLNAKDEYSFAHPVFTTEDEWRAFVDNVLNSANHLYELAKQLDDSQLTAVFTDQKYGTYFRNLSGYIEHTHYHLGQIALIKKLIRQ